MEQSKGSDWRGRFIGELKARGRGLIERLERRRAEALRRDPTRLTRSLRRARNVLLLCQGNVIRSVFAARLLSAALKGRSQIAILSAGLATESGWRPHPRVIARCSRLNIDVTGHSSLMVTETMVKAADVVLVMDISQAVAMTRRFPRARWKTFLLSCLAPEVPVEIKDPDGKDDAAVDTCLDHIAQALKPVIEVMTGR